ncbi:hypothetical protein MKX01_004982 [Papaver californicum]|nr:hypothetical protein MKX01_004982 [Papaver californicum]
MDLSTTFMNSTTISLHTLTILHNCSQYFGFVNETKVRFDLNGTVWAVQPLAMNKKSSVWNGDNPFNYLIPVFLAQASINVFGTSLMKFILEPMGVTSFVAQTIAALLMGPSGLGRTELMRTKIFSTAALFTLDTIQYFGSMFFLFLIGVKTDISMVRKSGRMALLVGVFSFFIPLILATLVAFVVREDKAHFPKEILEALPYIAGLLSLSSPHVINCFLADLNLLNSELGRIAMSASMISGGCSFISVFFVLSIKQGGLSKTPVNVLWTMCSCLAIIVTIIYVIQPIMKRIHRRTDHKAAVKEEEVFFIFLTVLISSFAGEAIGQHYLVGPLLLGLVVPPGPPLGAAIEDKLDFFVTGILVPLIVISRACPFSPTAIDISTFLAVLLLAFFGFVGKFLATVIPAIYSKMPCQDALILGLIMNVQGVLDIQIWVRAMQLKLINMDFYGSLVLTMVIVTGSISVLVKFLYDPSRKYVAYKRKTIQHSKPNSELRILACAYHEEHVPSIVNLLEASNPTTYSPICVYVLHLTQLQGRATPLLIAHKTNPIASSDMNPTTTRIIRSFKLYAHHNKGIVSVNFFTAISPYNTMHDDICSLGLDKRTSLIIIPFHHQPAILSNSKSSAAFRRVNINVLKKAPCSVGILIAKGGADCNSSQSNVAVIFLGGPDDREALAYGARIGDDVNVKLTVIRFMHYAERNLQISKEKRTDDSTIYGFRFQTAGSKNVEFIEETVQDGVELISSIKGIESSFDLLILGREHGEESSKLLEAFNEWKEFPELGVIGDMLVSSDSKASGSILVMQQRPLKKKKQKQSTKYENILELD